MSLPAMNDAGFAENNIASNAERAYLVGIAIKRAYPLFNVERSLDELARLAHTAGLDVVGRVYQNLERPNPATYIGSGKAEEVQEALEALNANVVIFDDELSPRHQRELERIFGEEIKVLDRSTLILDIFAQHAHTREGALQVELAQYEYRLPRLTRQWTHLARQAGGGAARGGAGGVGLRGPGETQLEVDRREIGRRIAKLKQELDAVRAHRNRHRQQRDRTGIPTVALVGYTNVGKSTLLNAMADADVYVADQLFATLDPTVRRVELPGGKTCLCSDTVGFIQKLPTTLIAAFRATLEEIGESDLLLHVADLAQSDLIEQIEVVEDTLAELDIPPMPRILVLNKIDLLAGSVSIPDTIDENDYDCVVMVSAKTGQGIESLFQAIEDRLYAMMYPINILFPYERGDLVARVYSEGIVVDEQHTSNGVQLKAQVPERLARQIEADLHKPE